MKNEEGFNYYEKFEEDLDEAKVYERYTRKLFEEIGFKFVKYRKDKYYDILMLTKTGKKKKIEVKSDKQTKRGNIIFEYRSYDKPSGIATSESDVWVNIFPLLGEVWFIKSDKLKELIKFYSPLTNEDSDKCWTYAKGGDGGNSWVYIWNREVFKSIIGDDLKIIKRSDIPND